MMRAMTTSFKNVNILGTAWLLGLILLFIQLDITQARSFSSGDDFFSTAVKRNTWWSKRMSPSPNTIDSIHTKELMTESLKCGDTLEIYECYIDNCVESFVTCARHAGTDDLFSACKMIHKLCASSCASSGPDSQPLR